MTMRDKVCRSCRMFVKGSKCANCGANSFSRSWKGVLVVNDPNTSEVAQLLGIKTPGKYCLWTK